MLLDVLVVTDNVPSSLIAFSLMMEAISSSETSALTGVKRHHIKGDCILHSHGRESLKSYTVMYGTKQWFSVRI
jgi:hypothetical protein